MTPLIDEVTLANLALALLLSQAEVAWLTAYADPHNESAWEAADVAQAYAAQAAARLAAARTAARTAITGDRNE